MASILLLPYILLSLLGILPQAALSDTGRNVSVELFHDLEELARIVDISYCIGATGAGIQKPFTCASRCSDFEDFELVKTWSTGQMLSDSCGYIALSHKASKPRIIVAFRGTYSVANTIADLSTIPQDYVDYDDEDDRPSSRLELRGADKTRPRCVKCSVHSGFMRSWRNTKPEIVSEVESAIKQYPSYEVVLVGHSLGGAVAALAGLNFRARGWDAKVTTFGEPRIGNEALAHFVDETFAIPDGDVSPDFRRVTHINDPIPLLPLTEWGYTAHGGEIFISKSEVPPEPEDVHHCAGDADSHCIAQGEIGEDAIRSALVDQDPNMENFWDWWRQKRDGLAIPARFRIWQLFFAHRDYFWRLGLCLSWSGPQDWED